MQNGVALEQSSSRDKPQQGQANRINPLETYPKLLLHHSGAYGLAPLYVHGQIERVVAQDSSPALPYCSVLRDDCESYDNSNGSGAGRLACERRVRVPGGRI